MKNRFWLPLVFAAVFASGMWIGWLLNSSHSLTGGEQKLMNIVELIKDKYVDEVDMDSLVEMAIPALLQNLDPHSSYIPAKNYELESSKLDGFSGIGISFQIMNDTLSVVEVVTDGPAELAGVLAGDKIIKVDNKVIAGKQITEDDVRSMLRGEKGTHVTITVKRSNSKKPLTFELTRDDIPDLSIDAAYMLSENLGYIKVGKFSRNTYMEFLQSIGRLKAEGAEDYIIDLRGNTGGYMEPAILIANEFLPAGSLIVSTKGRRSNDTQIIPSDGMGAFTESGLVVLIDEFSASASEIFSGAIQDNDRGWIIGRRSFGKGLVQSPILLPDSSEIRLTVQRYYTPSGRCIQKDYTPGSIMDYETEVINRYNSGELLSADSVKLKLDEKFLTRGGRKVYGGGGIMPDFFVPNDTSGVTSYYINVANNGLLLKFAYEYCDLNRNDLMTAKNVEQLLKKLPSNDVLLNSFVHYASINGVPARWYYINISSQLIVNQLKALIARDVLGLSAYYQIINRSDKTIEEGIRHAGKPLNVD